MKTAVQRTTAKRPINLLLSEEIVDRAQRLTDDLSATVDGLLSDFVARREAADLSRRQQAMMVAEAWNRFESEHGSFADEYATL